MNNNDTTSGEIDDRLLLTLSHAPLPTSLLDSLIEQTSSECTKELASIEEMRKKIIDDNKDDHKDEKKDTKDASFASNEKQIKRNVILHVLTTGTPYVCKPGKSQPDYIHQWTKGEKILALLVDKIGMHKFHRVPQDGETKLAGRLIDVKPSDFEFILNTKTGNGEEAGTNVNDGTNDGIWKKDCLREEVKWIADNILRMLIIDNRPNIATAKVLFPLDPRFESAPRNDLLQLIQDVFKREWVDAKGPLNGAKIEIIIVDAGTE
jgi:hypothetical protein